MSSLNRSKKTHSLQIPELRIDILKAFGADLNTPTRENLVFVNNVLCYPVGHHIALRDISSSSDTHRTNIMFIYLEPEILQITSLNVSQDSYLLLVASEFPNKAEINIYNLFKITFTTLSLYQPKRKVISSKYKRFIHATFHTNGNYIACIGETKEGKLQGMIFDIQSYQKYKKDNYPPKHVFDLPKGANKISYNKVICTSGNNHLSFWYLSDNTCKEYKSPVDVSKNYVDHAWVDNEQSLTLITVTEDNEIIVFNALYEVNKLTKKIKDEKIERFCLKQSITNVFKVNEDGQFITNFNNNNNNNNTGSSSLKEQHINKINTLSSNANLIFNDDDGDTGLHGNDDYIIKKKSSIIPFIPSIKLVSTRIYSLPYGIVIGTNRGNLLFLEKGKHGEFIPIRFTIRDKDAKVTGITASNINYDYLAISFDSNEIAYISLTNLFTNLKNEKFEINFQTVCEGFHSGPITTMDVAQQRPIIVTASVKDKSIRVWNYLTGHCEYCKVILEEKDHNNEKEMEILAVAIHPNGYYIAISDAEMIRFFHLCYKELRYYNNDQIGNEPNKANCTMMKFSNGGHLLAAVSERHVHLIRSYSRETIKTIYTPHSSEIISLYFHPNDNFLYTAGYDGVIVQYNLFDFNYVKIANKYVNYTSSGICVNYYLAFKQHQRNILYASKQYNDNDLNNNAFEDKIISCGYESMNQCAISTVSFTSHKTDELSQCEFKLSPIDCKSTSICNINTKRFNINSIAVGSSKGEICLYSHYNNEINGVVKFDSVISHHTKVNALYFSRDTNLLFSTGDDGNLFIYAIYETPDGENIQFEDNKNGTVFQLNSILDEGLGDNVLVSLYELSSINESLDSCKMKIYNLEKQSDEVTKTCEKMMLDKEREINLRKENEINELRNTLKNLQTKHETLSKQYQTKINAITNENRQKSNEHEMNLNEQINEMNAYIAEMRRQQEYLQEDYKNIVANKENDYLQKFKELEVAIWKRLMNYTKKNDLLITKLREYETTEKRKVDIIETEHELEMTQQNERYQRLILKNEKEIEEKGIEINKLKETNIKHEKTISSNENDIKQLKKDNDKLIETINTMRNQLDIKESEKDSLTKKLSELEQTLQEKAKLEGFSNQLKNELYIKNFELNSKLNEEIATKEELKNSTHSLEKQLEESILLLINREKEMNKQKVYIDELKQKWEDQKHQTNVIKKDYDNLLRTIYDTFQSNDKKLILIGITDIYRKYILNNDTNFDLNKINPSIQLELEKQIEFLQGQLGVVSSIKNKNDKTQTFQYQRKMQENSMLIQEMMRLKKINSDCVNEIKHLKFRNLTISQEIESNKKKLNANKTIRTNISNNKSNTVYNDTVSQMNLTAQIYQSMNNTNVTESTFYQSDLPMITNALTTMGDIYSHGKTKTDMGNLKNMKNRIFKAGQKLALPTEKAFKYKEMKKIIEGKNDIIQRLSVENDLLKKMHFTDSNAKKRTMSPVLKKDNQTSN